MHRQDQQPLRLQHEAVEHQQDVCILKPEPEGGMLWARVWTIAARYAWHALVSPTNQLMLDGLQHLLSPKVLAACAFRLWATLPGHKALSAIAQNVAFLYPACRMQKKANSRQAPHLSRVQRCVWQVRAGLAKDDDWSGDGFVREAESMVAN